MIRSIFHGFIGFIFLTAFSFCSSSQDSISNSSPKETVQTGTINYNNFKIGESNTIENLQVFLIHGNAQLNDKNYTSLSTAMEKNMVTVKETGSVNQLSIDNNSDEYVFIHSGDIVKGGKQDRTLAFDMIIAPKEKNVNLQSFCVESGRWRKRSGEDVNKFSSNSNMLSSKNLRIAAKYNKNQSMVWSNVSKEQQRLNDNVAKRNGYAVDVKSSSSATSLQLSLENKELKKAKKEMEANVKKLVTNDTSLVGFAYAINGKIYGVDTYNNIKLFREMWPKLAESIVVEAIAATDTSKFDEIKSKDIATFIDGINSSEKSVETQKLNASTDFNTYENKKYFLEFETVDRAENKWLHKNHLQRDSTVAIRSEKVNYQRQNLYEQQRNPSIQNFQSIEPRR